MLEQIDLSKEFDKEEYKAIVADLGLRLGELQREAHVANLPIMLVFEGWDAAGKGTAINRLIQTLDPRGFVVHPIHAPNEEERLRPFLWRFWTKTPAKGRIAVFDHSWYGRVLAERVDKLVAKESWSAAYDDICSFERQLTDSGALIIKFFLHISKKEQHKRFQKLEEAEATAWKVTKEDWRQHEQYDAYLEAFEEMFARTDASFAPWTIIEAHDRRFATVKVFTTIVERLNAALRQARSAAAPLAPTAPPVSSVPQATADKLHSSLLKKTDLSVTLSQEKYDEELKRCQKRIFELEHLIYLKRVPVVILYEGWDAAGKGGNIKRLTESMDPRGYEVIPIAAPNDVEKAHHYLWRFWMEFPKAGHLTIFDRTWYGRVLVERVEGFCREHEWKRAYREINEMEAHITNFGAVLVKFWLHIDQDEQLRRFQERQQTPDKQWKITDEDWRNREKWGVYEQAVDEMLYRTSTAYAPWTIVEANSKLYARIKTLKTVISAIEAKLS